MNGELYPANAGCSSWANHGISQYPNRDECLGLYSEYHKGTVPCLGSFSMMEKGKKSLSLEQLPLHCTLGRLD